MAGRRLLVAGTAGGIRRAGDGAPGPPATQSAVASSASASGSRRASLLSGLRAPEVDLPGGHEGGERRAGDALQDRDRLEAGSAAGAVDVDQDRGAGGVLDQTDVCRFLAGSKPTSMSPIASTSLASNR